jgi:hypothetical protein
MKTLRGRETTQFKSSFWAASAEERVRGALALLLVGILISLMFFSPGTDVAAATASAKTLAISVIAFYFGLHKATPHREALRRKDGKR